MRTRNLLTYLVNAGIAAALPSCGEPRATTDMDASIRWVKPDEAGPHGQARNAKLRQIGAQADGSKSFVLILSRGDEVATALADFARDQNVVNAHYVAIGGVRDPEVAWFDLTRNEYKGMSLPEQMEVLTLSGDIALGVDGKPIAHTHLVLGRKDGRAWGGHLLRATASPTLEIYVTTHPSPVYKRFDPDTGLQRIDPSITR